MSLVAANTDGTGVRDVVVTSAVVLVAFGGMLTAVARWAPAAVGYLIPLAAALTAVGLIEIHRIDPELGRLQRWWLLVGAAIAALTLYLLRRRGTVVLRRYRYLFLLLGIALLLLPLLPDAWPVRGATVNGSRLWVRLDLGSATLSFQPGEAAKLLIVAFLASELAQRGPALSTMRRSVGRLELPEPRQLLPVLLAFGMAGIVLIAQRDLGASLLLFAVFAMMLHTATGQASYLAAGGLLVGAGAVAASHVFEHVQTRVDAWLDPFADFTGTGYQVAQSLFALGSGGITGSGLGAGRPGLIPAAATDYVFAALAEETGLAGSLAVIAAFALLVTAGFGIALRARDRFRKLLAAGLTMTLAIQTALILAGVLRLLPVTGITLPFMSYGGSSLLANLVLVAALARISHEERA